jgi:hypothetical protein
MAVLRDMEWHRTVLERDAATLRQWITLSDEFAVQWNEFTAQGGINADDFERFLGGQFRGRPVCQRQHLRLVT